MYTLKMYTDGCCLGNGNIHARGGYAAIAQWNGQEKIVSGAVPGTKSNRMALKAVVEGLKLLKKPCSVSIYTDSQYVCRCSASLCDWKAAGWRTKSGATISNIDLIQELDSVLAKHQCTFTYGSNAETVRCSKLAKAKANELQKETDEELPAMSLEEAIRRLTRGEVAQWTTSTKSTSQKSKMTTSGKK